jgi:hypothetical protein
MKQETGLGLAVAPSRWRSRQPRSEIWDSERGGIVSGQGQGEHRVPKHPNPERGR